MSSCSNACSRLGLEVPARSKTDGTLVNVTLSPSEDSTFNLEPFWMPSFCLISNGIVVCPLLVTRTSLPFYSNKTFPHTKYFLPAIDSNSCMEALSTQIGKQQHCDDTRLLNMERIEVLPSTSLLPERKKGAKFSHWTNEKMPRHSKVITQESSKVYLPPSIRHYER